MNIPENFDRWMFDYLEDNLSANERTSFEDFLLNNPEFELEADAWSNAVVEDEAIAYPNEEALTRDKKVVGWYVWAAFFAGLLGFGAWFGLYSNQPSLKVTHSENQFIKNVQFANQDQALNTYHFKTEKSTLNTVTSFTNSNALKNNNAPGNSTKTNRYNANNNFVNITSVNVLGNKSKAKTELNTENYEKIATEINTVGTDINTPIQPNQALLQEKNKLIASTYKAKYLDNPAEIEIDLDVKRKSNVDYSSLSNQLKRVYKKIERRMGYPIGLVNLRDPELVIPENNILAFNPGFTGGMLRPRFEMNYRNQWLGTPQNSQQLTLSYDNYSHAVKGGVGITFNMTDFGGGGLGEYSVDLLYSPKIKIAKYIVFEPAIKVSLGMLTNNKNKLELNQTFESTRGLLLNTAASDEFATKNQLWYKDYGAGFVLNTKWFYLGASADNISNHYANVYAIDSSEPTRTPLLVTAVLGADYESASKNMTISPFVSYRNFGLAKTYWGGINYRLKYVSIGGAYSSNKDYTASIGLKFKKFKLIYHYDKTTSIVSSQKIASHNVGIRFNGEVKNARFK